MITTTIVLSDDAKRPGMRMADKTAGVGQVVIELEGGGFTVAELSFVFGRGGQRQALALARCLIEVSESISEWEAPTEPTAAPPEPPEASVDDTGVPF